MKPGGMVDALYAPRRTVLDAALVSAAREAGAEMRFGVTVTGLRRDVHGRVGGISGRHADGRALEVSAPMTIGADGIRSVVARAVEAPTYRSAAPGAASAFVYGHFAGVPGDGYDFYYRPGVSAGVIPTNDGAACVWIGLPASRFGQEIRADVASGFWRTLAMAAP
jgi:flavin-dependent dehydrogenase